MRIGQRIKRSADSGVLEPDMPVASRTKIKYALLGSAVPLAVLLGGALVTKRRKTPVAGSVTLTPALTGDSDVNIQLPHGGPGAQFRAGDLVEYIRNSNRDYIMIGQMDCSIADHPKPKSLDYWLRENYARNKETKQATDAVVRQLLATGLFEERENLRCPDTGERSRGLKLKPQAAVAAAPQDGSERK